MKRWMSAVAAISGLAISLVGLYASIVTAQLQLLDAPAAPVYATSIQPSDQLPAQESLTQAQSSLRERGIELSYASALPLSFAKSKPADISDKNTIVATLMLAEEFKKYTPSFISNSGLKKIYLVTDLSVYGQQRAGMPEPIFEDALYFAVNQQYVESENGNYIRRTFHHEYKHLIDYNMYGTYKGQEKTWKKCHSTEFTYGNGGASMYNDPEYAHAEHPIEGFVTGYATSAVEEDMAEVYAHFMMRPEQLQKLTNTDDVLSCKVTLTRQQMMRL